MAKAKKRKKTSKRGKSVTSRSSGVRVGGLPFRAVVLKGRDFPADLESIGYKPGTIPVVYLPDQPDQGEYSLSLSGSRFAQTRPSGASVRESGLPMMEVLRARALRALAKKMRAVELEDRDAVREADAELEDLFRQIAELAAIEAQIIALLAGKSKKEIERLMKEAAKRKARAAGAGPAQAERAAEEATSKAKKPGFAKDADDLLNEMFAQREVEEKRRKGKRGKGMASNPEVLSAPHKGVRHTLMLTPATSDTPGAMTVVLGPRAYQHATLSVSGAQKEMAKNRSYSKRMHMARKRMRRNPLGADLSQIGAPLLGAGAGFLASRVVNALALWGASKANLDLSKPLSGVLVRLGATGLGIAGTLAFGDKIGLRDQTTRLSVAAGMALNAIDSSVRSGLAGSMADSHPIVQSIALGAHDYVDVSHAGAPYAPMMGEYVAQQLNGLGAYVAQAAAGDGTGEYVAQQLNGMGEYVAQQLNGLGMYSEGVDPADQSTIDGMLNVAEAAAGVGATEVMAATAGLGTEIMAATAGLGADQSDGRGVRTSRGIFNFFTEPVGPKRARLSKVSIEQAPMPVAPVGPAMPGAVPIEEQLYTPEGRGYAGGIFSRHIFGGMS